MTNRKSSAKKKKKIITLFIKTPANMRIGVPRSDTAFLQRECAVVSEQVSIMEETIGKAENRLFAHARGFKRQQVPCKWYLHSLKDI